MNTAREDTKSKAEPCAIWSWVEKKHSPKSKTLSVTAGGGLHLFCLLCQRHTCPFPHFHWPLLPSFLQIRV